MGFIRIGGLILGSSGIPTEIDRLHFGVLNVERPGVPNAERPLLLYASRFLALMPVRPYIACNTDACPATTTPAHISGRRYLDFAILETYRACRRFRGPAKNMRPLRYGPIKFLTARLAPHPWIKLNFQFPIPPFHLVGPALG